MDARNQVKSYHRPRRHDAGGYWCVHECGMPLPAFRSRAEIYEKTKLLRVGAFAGARTSPPGDFVSKKLLEGY